MLTNLELLEHVSKQKKFTFISTGMSRMSDVEKAVKFLERINVNSLSYIAFQIIHLRKKILI